MKICLIIMLTTCLMAEETTQDFEHDKKMMHSIVLEIEEDKEEALEILRENEVEVKNSLEGVIEMQTAPLLKISLQEENCPITQPQIEDLSYIAQRASVVKASIVENEEIAGNAIKINPYENLIITQEEKQKISDILVTMAENNIFQLLFQKKRLERLGHEIHHVHPIRFMGAVFSDARLVYCMRRIRHNSFKWEGFIDGFTERIKQEAKAGNVDMYLPGLADTLDVKIQDIQTYVDQKDFEGLIIFLIENVKK